MPLAIRRIDVAGRDVTDALQTHLRRAGYNLHTSAEKEVVRMIKEKCCYIAMNPAKEEKDIKESEEFKLPDGNTIKVRCCTGYGGQWGHWLTRFLYHTAWRRAVQSDRDSL